MISAHILEPLVWSSVKEAIQNPGLILRQFERVRERVQKQAEMSEAETQRIDAAQAGLAAEENRLLEAYRAGVITLERLRAQMSQVDSRRKGLARERSALLSAPIMVQNAKAWLRHYSGFIRNRMRSLAYDERQKFLRSFVSEITIFDDSVHIKGYVPTEEPPRAETVLLCPNGMYGMDANKHLPFVLVRQLKHGKARPRRADNKE